MYKRKIKNNNPNTAYTKHSQKIKKKRENKSHFFYLKISKSQIKYFKLKSIDKPPLHYKLTVALQSSPSTNREWFAVIMAS